MKLITTAEQATNPKRHGPSKSTQELVAEYQELSGRECIQRYLAEREPNEPLPARLARVVEATPPRGGSS